MVPDGRKNRGVRMKEVLELAKELGKAIADCEEIKTYKEMEKIYFESEDAQNAMREYEETRAAMTVKAQQTGMTPESMQLFQEEMQKAMDKLMENKTVEAYLDAQSAFNDILTKVNSVIAYCVQGEEQNMATSSSGSCSGNCSGCAGCH